VLFVLVHLFEVIVTGPWNNLRSMISGRYRVEETPHER
jgi:thiosulfate reductase cytochrome b subunit